MYFMLGVLIATLVALLVLPAVWHRAVRLTTKRVEAAVPVSIFEVQADKDQQRAFYALNQRRLELQLDGLRETLVRQAADIEQKRRKIFDIEQAHADLGIRHAALTASGADRDVLLGEVQDQLADSTARVAALEADTAARAAAFAALTAERDELRRALDGAKADLDANRAAVQAFSQRRASEFAAMEAVHAQMDRLRADHAAAVSALAAGAADANVLKSALADFAARVTAETAQAEGAASPVPALLADAGENDLAARIKALLEGPEDEAGADETAEAARLAPDADPAVADDAEPADAEAADTEDGQRQHIAAQ